jgi:hypothetical protein
LDTCEVSSSSEELQSEMLKVKSCTVCERGLLTLAKIRIGNNVDPGLGIDNISMGNKYSTREGFYFSSFKDMESEYERSKYNHPYQHNTTEKMVNILCNILVNGDFNTMDKTDYLTPKS